MDYYEDELDRMRNRKKRDGRGRDSSGGRYTEQGDTYYVYGEGDGKMEAAGRGRGRKPGPGIGSRHTGRSRYSERSSSTDYYNRRDSKGRSGRKQKPSYGAGRGRGNGSWREAQPGKRKKKKKLLLLELSVLAVLVVAVFFLLGKTTGQKGFWTIAVFGVDSRTGKLEKGTEADVEMLCNINQATGEIKLVSVYRDTYLKIDGKGTYFKINEAYNRGGHKQAVAALEENLDIKIDDYATFNWKAVAEAINILGGVDIDITGAEFSYINGFITETVNSTGIGSYQLKKAGMNHLDGVQAVAYARLRLMDTDFNRTERQRKVLSLALQKAREADPSTLRTLVSTVFPQVSTSIGIDDLFTIASGIKKYHISETAGFPFSRITMKIDRRDCVVPTTLESNVMQLHQFLYGEEGYTPSSAVKTISAKLSKISGISEPGKNAPVGGSKGQKPAAKPKAPEAEAPPETEPSKEKAAETTGKASEETSSGPEESSPEKETNTDGSLVGPGAVTGDTEGKPAGTEAGEKPGMEPPAVKPSVSAPAPASSASPEPASSNPAASQGGGISSPGTGPPENQGPGGKEKPGEPELSGPGV